MEFESDISYEQVKQRLLSKTEPFDFSNRLSENTFLAKWNGNETFYLYKTGGIMSWRPYRVFTGKVSSRDIGSIISGDFLLDKQSKIFLV